MPLVAAREIDRCSHKNKRPSELMLSLLLLLQALLSRQDKAQSRHDSTQRLDN